MAMLNNRRVYEMAKCCSPLSCQQRRLPSGPDAAPVERSYGARPLPGMVIEGELAIAKWYKEPARLVDDMPTPLKNISQLG